MIQLEKHAWPPGFALNYTNVCSDFKHKHVLQYINDMPRTQHTHNYVDLGRFDKELRDPGPRDATCDRPSSGASVLKACAPWTLICG